MSSSSLLSIGTRALSANLAALQVIGNNIANVNTPGYSRQTAQLSSSAGQLMTGGFFGKGVDVTTVERTRSEYLTRQASATRSVASADAARVEKLGLLEPVFVGGATGVGASIGSLLDGFQTLLQQPTDQSARQSVMAKADDMVSRIRNASAQLDQLAQGLQGELADAVDHINGLTRAIADVNAQITGLASSGHTPNDLLDHRDQLVKELGQIVQVSTVAAPDGSLGVFAGGSQPLVISGRAMTVTLTPSAFDPGQQVISIHTPSGPVDLADGQISGGSVAGLMKFEQQDLTAARNLLGRLAAATATLVNSENRQGLDLRGAAGADLFTLANPPEGLSHKDNHGSAHIGLSYTDVTAFAASDYELRFESSSVDVVRLSDGQVTHFGSLPAEVDGVRIDIASGTAQVGDRFLLRPFAQAASTLGMATRSPTALAVANPVSAKPASTNTGGVQVAALDLLRGQAVDTAAITLTCQANGSFRVSGPSVAAPYDIPFVPGQPVQVNGWALSLTGTPQAGDRFDVQANTNGRIDGQHARGFLALRDLATLDGGPLTDGYASLLADVGARVQAAKLSSDVSSAMATQAEQSEAAVSGVNLDEEAARLLQHQQAYQAASRILQVAQSVFDNLLQGFAR